MAFGDEKWPPDIWAEGHRPPIAKCQKYPWGIDYFVCAHVLENQSLWAFSATGSWPKVSTGTSSHQALSFEPIHMSLRLNDTMIQPGERCFRKFQKAHLHAMTFHLHSLPRLYDRPLHRNSLEKLIFFENPLLLDILTCFGHFRWMNLIKTVKRHIYMPRPFI